MKIKKDSWHFALWEFTHTFTDKHLDHEWQIDDPVSLWRYGWRIVLMTIPTTCMVILMVIVAGGIMGSIILCRNMYTILTLQGVSWFNFTNRDDVNEPAFKWAWEFKRINQKPINASWWAKFFWLNLLCSFVILGTIRFWGYYYLIPYFWLIGGIQGPTLYLIYFLWENDLKFICKKCWGRMVPTIEFD